MRRARPFSFVGAETGIAAEGRARIFESCSMNTATLTWCEEARVDWRIIAVNFLYAGLGVVLMWVSYRLIDHFTPTVDFEAELKRGNVAAAIFVAALFLSIAIIVAGALN